MESAEAIAAVACSDVACCREAAALWAIVLPPYCLRGRVVFLLLPKNAPVIEKNIVFIQLVSGSFWVALLDERAVGQSYHRSALSFLCILKNRIPMALDENAFVCLDVVMSGK